MVFEAHCMSFLYRTLIIQLCQDKDSFPFYGTFKMSTCTEMTGVFEECYMSGLIKPVIFDMEVCLVWTDMLRSHDQTNNNTNIQNSIQIQILFNSSAPEKFLLPSWTLIFTTFN